MFAMLSFSNLADDGNGSTMFAPMMTERWFGLAP
jgi:hypothetical protein